MADRTRARSYDDVADAYDRGRPGYPETLIDAVVALAGLPPGGRILEIGCGSGQATLPFARRGYQILALEPGTRLAEIARERLTAFPNVEVRGEWFEEWAPEPHGFDLVLAATSLHHVDPDLRYARPATVLRPGGALAVLGHFPGEDDPPFRRELDAIYARWWGAATSAEYAALTTERRLADLVGDLDRSGRFGPAATRLVPQEELFDAERYGALLDSDSGRLRLAPADHERMKADVAAAIARLGGTVRRGYLAVAAVARPAGAPPPAG